MNLARAVTTNPLPLRHNQISNASASEDKGMTTESNSVPNRTLKLIDFGGKLLAIRQSGDSRLPQLFTILSGRFTSHAAEDAVEMCQRLKTRRERDLADAEVGIE